MLFQKKVVVPVDARLYQAKSPEAVSVARSAIGYFFAKLVERNGEWVDPLTVPTLLSFERQVSEIPKTKEWQREFDFEYWVWGNPNLKVIVSVTVRRNGHDRWVWLLVCAKMQDDPIDTDFGAAYWVEGPNKPHAEDFVRLNRQRFQNFISSTKPNYWYG